MSITSRWPLVALAALALAAPHNASPPGPEKIARWIKDLGADEFQRRQAASQRLWEAGEAAEPALRAVAGSADPEVAWRARDILSRFKWGIYRDTPKPVVELIDRYQGGDADDKGRVVKLLFEKGAAGCKAVAKITGAEQDAHVRRSLFAVISNEISSAVPGLLAEDGFDALESLLDTLLDQDVEAARSGINNYIAFWALKGKLDDRIVLYQARVNKNPGDTRALEVLAHLQRARGNLPEAIAAAKKAGQPELVEGLLQEAGQWQELAARSAGKFSFRDCERLALNAAYFRLAGDAANFEKTVAALRKLGDEATKDQKLRDDDGPAVQVAKALFLNDRPAEALDILVRRGSRAMALEVLVARMNYHDALKLAQAERDAGGEHLAEIEILTARVHWSLGRKELALPVFTRYGEKLKTEAEASWYGSLISAELQVGQRDQALKHASTVMASTKQQVTARAVLEKLFAGSADAAEVWWDYLRERDPARDAADVLKQVDQIVGGKLSSRQVKELVEAAQAGLKMLEPTPDMVDQWALAMAEAARGAGDDELARSILERAATGGAELKLGDLLADKKDWELAAEHYRRASDADHAKPLPLFLWGNALSRAGHEADGRRRIEQSHWLPLGNAEERRRFATSLERRGFGDASRREFELLLQISQPGSYEAGEALTHAASQARQRHDFLKSAAYEERAILRCLRGDVGFVEPGIYAALPAMIHREKARGLMTAGKYDESLREAALCLQELPGQVDLPIYLLPELEKAGRRREADELFGRVLAVAEGVCTEYPNGPSAHNSAAWLSVCCRRNLDAALTHARKAVELEPDPGYLDTLAEVLFQSGQKEQAVATQQKALALDPKRSYFQKQLARMKAGNPSAPRPADDDDDN